MGKCKPNAYSCFLEECRKKYKLFGNFQVVSQIVSPLWNSLTSDERTVFQNMAKIKKEELRASNSTILIEKAEGCLPAKLPNATIIKREESLVEDFSQDGQIDKYTRLYQINDELDHPLYLIQFMSLAKHDEKPYWVLCEVAMIEFSLKRGIIRKYETLIEPNEIPLGYSRKCKEKVSKYGLECFKNLKSVEKPDENIYKAIQEFCKDATSIFCVSSNQGVDLTNFALGFLSNKSSTIHVTPLECLFIALTNVIKEPKSFEFAFEELQSEEFQYSLHTECVYHAAHGPHGLRICALDLLHQYCFILFKYFCAKLNVHMIEGKHFPARGSVESYDRRENNESHNSVKLLAKQRREEQNVDIDRDLNAKFKEKFIKEIDAQEISKDFETNGSVCVKRKCDTIEVVGQQKDSKQFKSDSDDEETSEDLLEFLLENKPIIDESKISKKPMGRGRGF